MIGGIPIVLGILLGRNREPFHNWFAIENCGPPHSLDGKWNVESYSSLLSVVYFPGGVSGRIDEIR
jgi:hypothetical protein